MGQNVTCQESNKTKPIPISFAIFKDFSNYFEGVWLPYRALKFNELIFLGLHNHLGIIPKNITFGQSW